MVTVQRRMQCVPIVSASIASGLLLVLLLGVGRAGSPAAVALLALAPFVLAALTGVAKSSTP